MTVQEAEELRQDMMTANYEQECLDCELRNNYDFFLEYYQESLNNCINSMKQMKDLHEQHGHDFCCDEIKDMIND